MYTIKVKCDKVQWKQARKNHDVHVTYSEFTLLDCRPDFPHTNSFWR